ncbi:MAG: GtrA family protein [Saprospiraceae bacterium]|nr:GtrA family protein [Saprospiraceae bacterium]
MHEAFKRFILPKLKFASTSAVATAVDYVLYLTLVYTGLPKTLSNVISAGCGFLINFILQKKYVFALKRKLRAAFAISISASLVGIGLSTLLIYLFNKIPFLDAHQYLTKLLVIGLMFFYNFYTKRFAFEKTLKTGVEGK